MSVATAPSDAELITRVRAGDQQAYGELFARHADAARRLAVRCVRSASDADDLVAEAFENVLKALRRGAGPDVAFRAYLFTAIRRTAALRMQQASRARPVDEFDTDPSEPFVDPAMAGLERNLVARAYRSLPERWQAVLWHTEVEGAPPAKVAVHLGMSPNAVAALAYRAREGLRQAYLQMHLAEETSETCKQLQKKLGAYVRGGLSQGEQAKIDEHLESCAKCKALYLELADVNSGLLRIVAPLFLGSASAAYLKATAAAGAVGAGKLALLWKARPRGTSAVATGAAAAAVVAVGVTTLALVGPNDPQPPAREEDAAIERDAPRDPAVPVRPPPRPPPAAAPPPTSSPAVAVPITTTTTTRRPPTTTAPTTTAPPPTTTLPPPPPTTAPTTTVPPTTTTVPNPQADLQLAVTGHDPGAPSVVTATVTNLGPDPAVDAYAQFTFVAEIPRVCRFGTLAPGASDACSWAVPPRGLESVKAGSATPDPNPGNNTYVPPDGGIDDSSRSGFSRSGSRAGPSAPAPRPRPW